MSGRVVSIQVGLPRQFVVEGVASAAWTSAIVKEPVTGSVYVSETGLHGDAQADCVHHGGADKAVLAYSFDHYSAWSQIFPGHDFGPGGFGENLTVRGWDEMNCCLGDTFRVGDCVLQVSQPRQPCWKLDRRWNIPKLAVQVQQNRRTGWYLRVLTPGTVENGQEVILLDRPHPEWSVDAANAVMYARPRRGDDDLRLAGCPALAEAWRVALLDRSASP